MVCKEEAASSNPSESLQNSSQKRPEALPKWTLATLVFCPEALLRRTPAENPPLFVIYYMTYGLQKIC
jgi:hypothetical protein